MSDTFMYVVVSDQGVDMDLMGYLLFYTVFDILVYIVVSAQGTAAALRWQSFANFIPCLIR